MPVTLRSRRTTSDAPREKRKIKAAPKTRQTSAKTSTRVETEDHPAVISPPRGLTFQLQPAKYGLIQERIRDSLYALVVQAILWNQTRGQMARPVLFKILAAYPSPLELSAASLKDLTAMLQPIGLHRIRAARLIALAQAWLSAPPCKERRYRRLHYPDHGCGANVKPGEVLRFDDEREGWEIAHLPGMGAYAIDSYRIFYRDLLREVEPTGDSEPEWKRVVPLDKELIPYLKWRRREEK